jgi:hypothetical protein
MSCSSGATFASSAFRLSRAVETNPHQSRIGSAFIADFSLHASMAFTGSRRVVLLWSIGKLNRRHATFVEVDGTRIAILGALLTVNPWVSLTIRTIDGCLTLWRLRLRVTWLLKGLRR